MLCKKEIVNMVAGDEYQGQPVDCSLPDHTKKGDQVRMRIEHTDQGLVGEVVCNVSQALERLTTPAVPAKFK